MHLIRRPLLIGSNGFAVTIGNFDGVHLGHQSLIKTLNETAKKLHLPSLLLTFEPHPQEFFMGIDAPARLTTFREKMRLLQDAAIDTVLCLPFSKVLSLLSPDQFIKDILVNLLKVKYLLVGDDFRFGYKRQGDIALLERQGAVYGYQVERAPTVFWNEKRIGSTWIREALAKGDFKTAESLLGRPYCMVGHVSEGDKRGRQLGFPTANIRLKRWHSPLWGVFVGRAFLESTSYYGVANIGNRPTLDGLTTFLEVHLFDFNQDLYGKLLKIEFLHKLRDEHRFESVAALKHQIQKDVTEARKFIFT